MNTDKFSPLRWNNQAWGISAPSGLRSWASPALSVDGKTVAAFGNYGKGKVIWTGINWVGHINTYKNNPEEIKFVKNLFQTLIPGKISDEDAWNNKITMKRDFPDKVEFTFKSEADKGGSFYFRESYHPDWKASLVSANDKTDLTIYKSGPLYKLVRLPAVKAGDKLVFEFNKGIRGTVSNLVSLLALFFLLLYLFLGERVIKPALSFMATIKKPVAKSITDIAAKSEEDEEY